MPTLFSYKNDDDIDERANPFADDRSQEEFDEEAREILDDAGLNNPSARLNQLEQGDVGAPAIENPNRSEKAQDQLRGGEYRGTDDNIKFNQNSASHRALARLNFLKERGGIIGLVAAFGISGGLLAAFFGPATMLINLNENLKIGNDSSSPVMERRLRKVLAEMFDPNNSDNLCISKSMKCISGQVSYKSLDKLAKKGVVALDGDSPIDTTKEGYPEKKPTHFEIEDSKSPNQKIKITAAEFSSRLNTDAKFRFKVLGTRGAFNMSFRAWTGKYITKKLFRPFNLNKKGGIAKLADSINQKLHITERINNFKEGKIKNTKIANAVSAATKKIDDLLKKGLKGGGSYAGAVAVCIAPKTPAIVGGAVAAVQLAQLLYIVQDLVLSPGSMEKASGFDSGFEQEAAEAAGVLLTTRVINEAGKLSSALDSAVLHSAMGINKNKVAIPTKLAPAYSILTSEITTSASAADKALTPACNTIMNPLTMYSWMTIKGSNVAAMAADYLLGKAMGALTEVAMQAIGSQIISAIVQKVATNQGISDAEGEALGDVVGLGAMAFFASGSMGRHIPILKRSQVAAFNAMKKENEEQQREAEIASLSPLDTSSRYTFLGSILFNMRTAMISSGNYNNTSLASIFSNIFSFPSMALSLSSTANAQSNYATASYCDYTSAWQQETENSEDDPAMLAVGLGCGGITQEQDDLSPQEARETLIEADYLNDISVSTDGVEVEASDDIESLVKKGYIKSDTPITEYIESCSNPASGDYMFNVAGCTVDDENSLSYNITHYAEALTDSQTDETPAADPDGYAEQFESEKVKAAIAVFLLDVQTRLSVQGEDDGYPEDGSASATNGTIIDGTVQELARLVAENENISFVDANTKADLLQIANGQAVTSNAGTPMVPDKALLQTLLYMAQNYSMLINNIGWSNERYLAENSTMPHPSGHAVDLNGITSLSSGQSVGSFSFSSDQMSLINSFTDDWITGASQAGGATVRVGQLGCGGFDVSSKVTQFTDECNHIHIEAFGGG